MMNIKDYWIVEANNIEDLRDKVKVLIVRGYELQGGVSKSSDGNYLQALIFIDSH